MDTVEQASRLASEIGALYVAFGCVIFLLLVVVGALLVQQKQFVASLLRRPTGAAAEPEERLRQVRNGGPRMTLTEVGENVLEMRSLWQESKADRQELHQKMDRVETTVADTNRLATDTAGRVKRIEANGCSRRGEHWGGQQTAVEG